jgi:type I restriction enzyme R subunit
LTCHARYRPSAEGNSYDARQAVREHFYEVITKFGMCLKAALSSRTFFEDMSFSEKQIEAYKNDLRFFTSLRHQTPVRRLG